MVFSKTFKMIQEFIQLEAASGIILFIMAILAIALDNSPLSFYYNHLLSLPVTAKLGMFTLSEPLLFWVNSGLMTLFFFLVGLEIKREMIEGELNSFSKISLPGIAAIGGMIAPALIYYLINKNNLIALQGWAIPTATDIAFALGVLILLGKRVPISLKVLLTAIAILDDLGAILIIAIFYTLKLSYLSLGLAALCLLVLLIFNLINISMFTPYALVGMALWLCVLKSGVHATLTGVILAMAIPLRSKKNPSYSLLRTVEHGLHPWVAFGVLPIFAFFNAGISFSGMKANNLWQSIPLGIILGLFLGKQAGVFFSSWLAVKLGCAKLPNGLNWQWLYGLAILCGVGFTMSLFIGTLAFANLDPSYLVKVHIGVLTGSLISGIVGYLVLFHRSKNR